MIYYKNLDKMKTLFLLLLLLICNCVNAKLYTKSEVNNFFSIDTNLIQQRFIKDYKASSSAENFIESKNRTTQNPLKLESNYLSLLEHVETQPNSEKNKSLVDQLKNYQPQAMKMHEEGNLQIPVFNVSARAQGVENYWSYLELKQKVTADLDSDYLSTLIQIKIILSEQHEAKTFALKKSIHLINKETKNQLSKHFINDLNSIAGIEKFVIDFAVIYKDKNLLDKLIHQLAGRNADYLVRQLVDNFSTDFVIDKLIEQVKSDNGTRLAMSLLKPYVNSNIKVQNLLIDSLQDNKFASVAAFSLSGLTEQSSLNNLKDRFVESQSEFEKNHILLSLKLNERGSAQAIFKQLKQEK